MFVSTWPGHVLGTGNKVLGSAAQLWGNSRQGVGAEPVRYPDGMALLVTQIVHPEGL